jgi:crotonobetainyl-CoA:carnitine CoA-transferase CaiB-like acyl-CoA transferase
VAPLTGLKVIEAASFLSGPMAGMMLADLGATVVKVEPPRGDPYRRFGKPYGDSSLLFKAANGNKTSIALDLKSEDGIASLFELLAEADVLITNWRPSVAPKMGLTPERVKAEFPRLIWCRVSGYGQDGPRSDLPAYDGIVQARSGAVISGTSSPMNTNNNVADKVSAMFAAQTITAALHQRERTGTGSICDMAMVDAMAYFYGADISAGHRVVEAEPDTDVALQVLSDSNFETAEGYLTLAPVTGRQLRRAMESAGCADAFGQVMDAPRAETFNMFATHIGPKLMERAAIEWEEIFAENDVPAAAVRDFAQHISDPQTVHNGTYQPVADDSVDGDWMLVRFPAFFDGEVAETAQLPAPALGETDADGSAIND